MFHGEFTHEVELDSFCHAIYSECGPGFVLRRYLQWVCPILFSLERLQNPMKLVECLARFARVSPRRSRAICLATSDDQSPVDIMILMFYSIALLFGMFAFLLKSALSLEKLVFFSEIGTLARDFVFFREIARRSLSRPPARLTALV